MNFMPCFHYCVQLCNVCKLFFAQNFRATPYVYIKGVAIIICMASLILVAAAKNDILRQPGMYAYIG